MISENYVDEFIALVDPLPFDYRVFEEIVKIIEIHNRKTMEFEKSIIDAQKLVEIHHISEFADEINFYDKSIK